MDTSNQGLPGWLLPVGLGVLVVILVAVALSRSPVELDPDSPEGTVQEYLLALSEERWDDAVEVVHEEWRGACEGTDLEAFSQGEFTAELGNDRSGFGGASIEERFVAVPGEDGVTEPTIPEEASQVEVTISHNDGPGLGSNWSEFVAFDLADDGEFWWLVGDPWPYFVWNCRER